jgi:mRNA-degrading endonuclease toxin of MazEF toxin-antitoxin module
VGTKSPSQWYPRRGEVYLADVDKVRPVVVVSTDALNCYSFDVCIVPLTRVRRQVFSIRARIPAGQGGLRTDCWAKCDQVTTLERIDLHYPPLGVLPAETLAEIGEHIKTALELDQPVPE